MTSPSRYIIRMTLFMAVIVATIGGLFASLREAFLGNAVINSIIIIAFLFGIIYVFRQAVRLLAEYQWVLAASKNINDARKLPRPVLLAPLAIYMSGERQITATAMRAILDSVAARIDEAREISRYMIGLLIFLGLLGTFWGLLATITAVSNTITGLDTGAADIPAMMEQLKAGLDAPLHGMATAFSSSLFGLAGSLVLGFLDLQLGQASGRFYTDLEDWFGKSVAAAPATTTATTTANTQSDSH